MSEENFKITPRSKDYSQWYLDVISSADLADYAPVKGCMIIKPDGYVIWQKIQAILDDWFAKTGVRNAYFPLFIPEKFLNIEKEHVEGFSPEVAVVTHAGGKKLEEPLIVRPTSETIMYEAFSRWIHSYRDLPFLINQWANIVRWEMRPRLFLRTTEFLWQEGHTAHATFEEANERALQMLHIYQDFAKEYLAIPTIIGRKIESEKFPGAFYTYTVEAMMQDGKALQFATSHHLGQNFSKPFNIVFLNKENKQEYVWQTSWGLSTRVIGAIIMTHSDDSGLVLPPKITNTSVVLIPILTGVNDEKILEKSKEILNLLEKEKIKAYLDISDKRPGEKFYYWERKGIPLRLEIGSKEIEKNIILAVRRDTFEKIEISFNHILDELKKLLDKIQENLYLNAEKRLKENIVEVNNFNDFCEAIENGKFVSAFISETKENIEMIKEKTKATARCIPFEMESEEGKCIISGEKVKGKIIFAKAY